MRRDKPPEETTCLLKGLQIIGRNILSKNYQRAGFYEIPPQVFADLLYKNKENMKTRVKFFKDGHKTINVRPDLYELISEDAERRALFPVQVLQEIIIKHYNLKVPMSQKDGD